MRMKIQKMNHSFLKKLACSTGIAMALGISAPVHALVINLTSTGNANADLGFQTAANFWESKLTDNVSVNITAGFAALDPNILGQAGSTYFGTNFSGMKSALGADATSAKDAIMVAGLASGSTYSKLINGTFESSGGPSKHVHAGIETLQMTRANAKAIGLVNANALGEDAEITFSSNFNFDFDSSNGIAAGFFDFVGVAIHEIGHALGFVSGVDLLDYNRTRSANFRDAQFDPFATVLDFTRCSTDSKNAGASMDWSIGPDTKDFSINGTCSGTDFVSNAWSTGAYYGDGRQASHWKDQLGRGIMDPTMASGETGVVSSLDLLAFDVIGWDLQQQNPNPNPNPIPEPSSALLLGTVLVGLGVLRRRNKSA